ncbi:MAG TPA: lytic murein transglycosylase [Xanthobacteraceae bacterium]|nr:lytic murein transglycosylase [Xanthobacteraceae bacterium]
MRAGFSGSLSIGILLCAGAASGAWAATCQTQSFERWLDGVRQEAAAQGVAPAALAALDGLAFDPAIVRRDHGQGVFQQSFLQFSDRMAAGYRIQGGIAMIKRHADLFARIEKQYGVPAPVITAFWALESDFGSNNGHYPILRAVATLAYDCRRPQFFRTQLIDALRIIQRGDLRVSEMIGDWAGELGPLQFTPSDYYKYAVDYDGDGRRDLIHSVPDLLASGANFLAGLGWKGGEPWLQEVRAGTSVPWDQADLSIRHPRSQWVRWGVTYPDGRPLPGDDTPASLLLPMGRLGPAFLAYDNFQAYLGWNASLVYSTTAAYLSTRIAGASPMHRGQTNIPVLSAAQVMELQQLLMRHGFSTAKPDGKLGLTTRAGVRVAQMKVGLAADSYPTPELIEKLRRQ